MTERKNLKMNLQLFAGKPKEDEPAKEVEKDNEEVEKEPVKETEDKVEKEIETDPVDVPDNSKDISDLEAKVSELSAELDQAHSDNEQLENKITELEAEKDAAATDLKAQAEMVESYSKVLEGIAAEQEKAIPDNIKALMPNDLTIDKKVDWLSKAAGVKPADAKEKKVVEIGKPTPINDQVIDQSELSARQKMANAFSGIFK